MKALHMVRQEIQVVGIQALSQIIGVEIGFIVMTVD